MSRLPWGLALALGGTACVQPDVNPSTVVGNPGSLTTAATDQASARRVGVPIASTSVDGCDGSTAGAVLDADGAPLEGPIDLATPLEIRLSLDGAPDPSVCGVILTLEGPIDLALDTETGGTLETSLDVEEIVISGAPGLPLDTSFVVELGFPGWAGASVTSSDADLLADRLATGSGLFQDPDSDGVISPDEREGGPALAGELHPETIGLEAGAVLVGGDGLLGYTQLDGSGFSLALPADEPLRQWVAVEGGPSATVAVGGVDTGPLLASSVDLDTWDAVDASGQSVSDLAYGGGRWVAAGLGNQVFTSVDGRSWDQVFVAPDGLELYAVTYGGGRFVIGGEAAGLGALLTSTDGQSWSEVTPVDAKVTGLAWGGGRFVGVGLDGLVVTSTDGSAWTPVDVGLAGQALSVVRYTDDTFVIVNGSDLLESGDGTDWTTTSIGLDLRDLIWTGTTHVGISNAGQALRSADRRSWTALAGSDVGTWAAVGVAGR